MSENTKTNAAVRATHVRGLLALRRLPIFAGVPAEEALGVADRLSDEGFEPGAVVCREGGDASDVFVVISGQVDLTRGGLAIASLGTGELFGEAALLDAEKHLTTATAAVSSRVLRMDRVGFHELIDTCPPFQRAVVAALAGRMRQALYGADALKTTAPGSRRSS